MSIFWNFNFKPAIVDVLNKQVEPVKLVTDWTVPINFNEVSKSIKREFAFKDPNNHLMTINLIGEDKIGSFANVFDIPQESE